MPVTNVGPVDVFYTDEGTDDPPVLLVHGWTCDSHDWTFQLAPFAERHRVIAPDLRGHGRSSTPESGYTVAHHAADLAGLLHLLDTGPVVAVGHSLGGNIVTTLAIERPDLVRAVVTTEPAYGMDPATAPYLASLVAELGTQDGNGRAADAVAALEPDAPAWLRTWHRRRTLGMDPRVLKEAFAAIYFADDQFAFRPRSDAQSAKRSCPVLALHRFQAMAAWEESTFSHPDSRAVGWEEEGVGHWLHQERHEEFNELVLGWIDRLPPVTPN